MGGKKVSLFALNNHDWEKQQILLGASSQYHVFSLFQTLLSSCRPDTYSMTVCYCLNTDFHGSRTLLIFVSSLFALLTLLWWSVTWAPGRPRLTNPRENHVSLAAMTVFWKEHVTGLSWATRGSQGTGSIFPLLKRLQVQLRVLNSTVWYWQRLAALFSPVFLASGGLAQRASVLALLAQWKPHGLEHTDVFFPWAPKGTSHFPWAYKLATARQHGKAQVCLCAWQHLAVTDPGKHVVLASAEDRTLANASTIGTARPWFYFHCKEQMFSWFNLHFTSQCREFHNKVLTTLCFSV